MKYAVGFSEAAEQDLADLPTISHHVSSRLKNYRIFIEYRSCDLKKPNIWPTAAEIEAESSRLRASYPLEFSTLEGNIRTRLSMVDDEEIENHRNNDRMIPFFLFKIKDQHSGMHQGYCVNMLGCLIRGIADQVRSGRN